MKRIFHLWKRMICWIEMLDTDDIIGPIILSIPVFGLVLPFGAELATWVWVTLIALILLFHTLCGLLLLIDGLCMLARDGFRPTC